MQDILNILTLVGAIQGFFFSLVLFRMTGGNRVANRFLALFLLFVAITMIGIVGYASHWVLRAPHTALLHTPVGAVMGVPLLLYIIALSGKDFRMRLKHWALFLPFVVVLIWLLPFYGLPEAEKMQVLEASYIALPDTWIHIFIFSNIVNFAQIVGCYVLILRHERVIREVYSSPLNKTLLWTRQFLIGGTLIFLLCVVMSFMYDITWSDSFSNFLFSLLIYGFGYRAMRQPDIFADVSADAIPDAAISLIRPSGKYEKSGLSETKAHQLLEKLEQLMASEKIYLNPTLNLQQLAGYLDVSPHQLSQLLNQFRGESFSDYINRYRVDHFKTAAVAPDNAHLSLLAIAFDSGFNSKAAFNAVFKKMTGQTPSDFVKKVA